jgi:hypothetical protein
MTSDYHSKGGPEVVRGRIADPFEDPGFYDFSPGTRVISFPSVT